MPHDKPLQADLTVSLVASRVGPESRDIPVYAPMALGLLTYFYSEADHGEHH